MLSVVTWLWSTPGYRSTFGPAAVNALAHAVRRHYARPHRFLCVTDQSDGIDQAVEIVPPWDDFVAVPSPHGGSNPSCYRRLRGFHPDAARAFGPRFVSLDLDMVAVADLAPLWDRPEAFVGLRDPLYPRQLNGSMFLMDAGARPLVWTQFDPERSPAVARRAGYRGSDQAWMSYALPGEQQWTAADGVLSYRADILPRGGMLPPGARLVSFHGRMDPWHPIAQRLGWVREHWGSA